MVFAGPAFNDQLRTLGPCTATRWKASDSRYLAGPIGRYEDAKKFYLDAIATVSSDKSAVRGRDVFGLWYNLAALPQQAGRRDEAFDYLHRAIEAGYNMLNSFEPTTI